MRKWPLEKARYTHANCADFRQTENRAPAYHHLIPLGHECLQGKAEDPRVRYLGSIYVPTVSSPLSTMSFSFRPYPF
ncbi:Uncharacterised protein [Vibrio cholerae]|nr:Uncharacterised protein [Vibrio cholerae]